MGANGSGKSTLVRHFNALLLPHEGSVLVDGIDTQDAARLWDIRERVGMVFQNPDHQMVASVVEEEVAFGPENLALPAALIRERVAEALGMLELEPFALANPAFLSGGQKQRLAIASILAMRPSILVLDEPTAMLDAAGRRETMEAVLRLHREEKLTVVLVTHSLNEAVVADRIVVLEDGRVAHDGPVWSALETLADGRAYFELPAPLRLARLLREGGLRVDAAQCDTVERAAQAISIALQ